MQLPAVGSRLVPIPMPMNLLDAIASPSNSHTKPNQTEPAPVSVWVRRSVLCSSFLRTILDRGHPWTICCAYITHPCTRLADWDQGHQMLVEEVACFRRWVEEEVRRWRWEYWRSEPGFRISMSKSYWATHLFLPSVISRWQASLHFLSLTKGRPSHPQLPAHWVRQKPPNAAVEPFLATGYEPNIWRDLSTILFQKE